MRSMTILLSAWLAASPVFADSALQASPRPLGLARSTPEQLGTSAPTVVALPTPDRRKLSLRSDTALIVDQERGHILYAKNSHHVKPIASITKLMTAMVVLDAGLPGYTRIRIADADKDRIRYSRSHLPLGSLLTREELLRIALMASENRAAAALARTYPGGMKAFVKAMNRKAQSLGMRNTTFFDATGLHGGNTSTAEDLVALLQASYNYPKIREYTTMPYYVVRTPGKVHRKLFTNTNRLVRGQRPDWAIGLSKTGYILEAGRCLVMQAEIASRPLLIVLLDAWGKYTSIGDANRIRKWLEKAVNQHADAADGRPS